MIELKIREDLLAEAEALGINPDTLIERELSILSPEPGASLNDPDPTDEKFSSSS